MALVIHPGVLGSAAIKRIAYLVGLDEFAVFGRLARLWEESQRLGKVSATVDEIGFWLGSSSPEESEKWARAYADPLAGFLKPLPDGTYEIRGNAKHVEKQAAISERNRRVALNRVVKSTPGNHVDSISSPDGDHVVTSTSDLSHHLDTPSQAKPGQAKPSKEGSSNDNLHNAFEEIYKAYPRRSGSHRKQDGLRYCARHFKSQEQIEKLRQAVSNYAQFCHAQKKTGTELVMQFATFVNGVWEEWAEPRANVPRVKVLSLEAL